MATFAFDASVVRPDGTVVPAVVSPLPVSDAELITGEILYGPNGIWYWSPTGEPGTWAYPVGQTPVFTPEPGTSHDPLVMVLGGVDAYNRAMADLDPAPLPWLASQPVRFPSMRVEFYGASV